jgi:hypothetical protein
MVDHIPSYQKKVHITTVGLAVVSFLLSMLFPHYEYHRHQRSNSGEITETKSWGVYCYEINKKLALVIEISTYFLLFLCILSSILVLRAKDTENLRLFKYANYTIYIFGSLVDVFILQGLNYARRMYIDVGDPFTIGAPSNESFSLGYSFWLVILGILLIGLGHLYLHPGREISMFTDTDKLYPRFVLIDKDRIKNKKTIFFVLFLIILLIVVPEAIAIMGLIMIILLLGLVLISVLSPIISKQTIDDEFEIDEGDIMTDNG